MPSDRSRMMKGTDRRRREAATARPEGPAPMMMGPGTTETFGSLSLVLVAMEKEKILQYQVAKTLAWTHAMIEYLATNSTTNFVYHRDIME